MVVVVSPPQGHGPGPQGPGSHNLRAQPRVPPGCTRSGAAAWGLLWPPFPHRGALFGYTTAFEGLVADQARIGDRDRL